MKVFNGIKFYCHWCKQHELCFAKSKNAKFFKCHNCKTETVHIRGSYEKLLDWYGAFKA